MNKKIFLEKAKKYCDEKHSGFWEVITRNAIDKLLKQKEVDKTTPEKWMEKRFDDYSDYLSMPES